MTRPPQPDRPRCRGPWSKTTPAACGPRRRLPFAAGFTLVEVLVVISIIGVLVALVALGAGALREAVREKNTRALIVQLESVADEFRNQVGTVPNLVKGDPEQSMRDFLAEAVAVEECAGMLASLPPSRFDPNATPLQILDDWDQPIRLYGPDVRRKNTNNTAYTRDQRRWFWSLGPDGIDQSVPANPLPAGDPVTDISIPYKDNFAGELVKGDDAGGTENTTREDL